MGFKVKRLGAKKGTLEFDVFPDSTASHRVNADGGLDVTFMNEAGETRHHGYGPGVWADVIEGEWTQVVEITPATRKITAPTD